MEATAESEVRWSSDFDADGLARLELEMWQAYYRHQHARLFRLLVRALHREAHVAWPRALVAALWLTRGAVRFARMRDNYDRVLPDIKRGYGTLRPDPAVDLEAVSSAELRWWTIRRELGLSSGEAAGEAIARLYAAIYGVPLEVVAEAGRLRGVAAQVRDRGAENDPDGQEGVGSTYWPQVAELLRESYRALGVAVAGLPPRSS
jgi:hypothetical protein